MVFFTARTSYFDSCPQSFNKAFGDRRISKLATEFLDEMTSKGSVCIRKLGNSRNKEVAFGRLLKNKRFTVEPIISNQISKTKNLSENAIHVLLIQDSVFLYSGERGKIKAQGMGVGGNGKALGFYLHPMISVDANTNTCYGLTALYQWVRNEETEAMRNCKAARSKTSIIEKESYRWIECANQSKSVFNSNCIKTVIADRESDIYEEFCLVPDSNTHLITRASHNRCLVGGGLLFETLDKLTSKGTIAVDLPEIKGKRKARTAHMSIRFKVVEIKKPSRTIKDLPSSISMNIIDVKEKYRTKDRIHWRLLTTHQIDSLEDAIKIIDWYKQRWHIEQLFRTMKKQGLRVEQSQIQSHESLSKITSLALIAAVDILKLTIARDGANKREYVDVFEEEDKKFLELLNKKYQGKTEKQKNKHKKYSLAWSSWIIARLGGWKGYSCERPPGPITMFDGWSKFQNLKLGWSMALEDVCIR